MLQQRLHPRVMNVKLPDGMVLPHHMHSRGLGTALALLFGKAHFGADHQFGEATVDHAVLVEVHQPAVGSLYPAEGLVRVDLDDAPVRLGLMQFDVAATAADMIFQPPARGVEGIADRDIHILVCVMRVRRPADDQFAARNFRVHADMIEISLMMMPVELLDHDTAAHHPIVELFEPFSVFSNIGIDGL